MLLLDLKIVIGIILWLFSLTDVSTGQQSSRRYAVPMRRPITRQIVAQCALPYFPNGEAKLRNRGRMMRFDCTYGFKLVGNRYTNCNNGRWDTPIPVCVKSGCATLPLVESGFTLYEMNKATAWLSCFDGTELAGSKHTYCNGTHWDRPLGVCRRTGQGTATSCDFEAESMCGWTNDALHDFDWKRSDGTLNPRALRTGPKYDHTKMEPKAGHFMIVDSAEQFTNDTARFISPMFEPELSIGACFQFYYHMYGETVGSLKVYVKPMTSDLYDLKPSFVLEGNQKNVWHEGHIEIAEQAERFQIVFEASLGMRYKSDIAIDDVSLLQGDSCKVAVEDGLDNPEEVPTDPEKVPVKIDSCENRCGVSMAGVLNNSDTIVHCDCHEDCVVNATCCPDFRERCVFEVLPAVNASSNTSAPVSVSTVATTVTTKQLPTTSTAAATTTTATTTTVSTTSTTVSTTTKAPTTTPTTTAKPSTTPRTTSAKPSTTPRPTSTTSTTKPYNLRPRPTFVPMTNRPRWTTSTTRRTTVTSTARPTTASTSTTQSVRSSTPTTVVATTKATSEPTQSDMVFELTEYEATTNGLLAPGFAIASFPAESIAKPQSLAKFFICAIVGVAVFVSILCITYNYARKSRSSVLARLKEKSQKKCFEDIRFLAGEEDLDFNISHGSEATEDEKDTGKKGCKKPDTQTKASHPDAEAGGQSKKDTSGGEKRIAPPLGGDEGDSRQDNADVAADCDSENDSSNEDDGHAGGANGTNGRSTKKAYHKYVKYYDEDMTSTLL